MRATAMVRERSAKARADWAAQHPERAASEARLAQAQRRAVRDFGHKVHGTTETHARAARTRQGAIARLYEAGHLSIDQLGAALELAAAAEATATGLSIRTMSMETRVDTSPRIGGQFFEALGAVRREVTFNRWREAMLAGPGVTALALARAVAVDDVALRTAAKCARMRDATARQLLGRALNLWNTIAGDVRKEIEPADLLAAQAGIL